MSLLKKRYFEEMDAPYKDDVLDIIGNEHLMDTIADYEIASIKTNKEEAFYICGDNIIPLFGAKSADSASVWHTPRVLADVCGATKPKAVHLHGPYLSIHSNQDKGTHKFLYDKGFVTGCAVGIDGIRCEVPSGHEYAFAWSDKFYEKARRNGVITIDNVKATICHHRDIDSPNNKECSIFVKNSNAIFTNLFSEHLWEQHNSLSPYMWVKESDKIPFLEKSASRPSMCVVSETERPSLFKVIKENMISRIILGEFAETGKKRRILTCFFRED